MALLNTSNLHINNHYAKKMVIWQHINIYWYNIMDTYYFVYFRHVFRLLANVQHRNYISDLLHSFMSNSHIDYRP